MDQSVLILANKESTAIEILTRIRFAYELLPNYLKPGVKTWGKSAVEFENGSKIEASTTSTDSGRGKSISCIAGSELITIRNKTTGEVKQIPIQDLLLSEYK